MIWSDLITQTVSVVIGLFLIGYAISLLVGYFRNKERKLADNASFVYAITLFVSGFILVFKVDFLKELISFVVGIYILLTSIIKLKEGIIIGRNLNTKLTGSIVLSILGILIGIMCIVGKIFLPDMIITYIGILLIIYSIISIANIIIIRRK